MTCLNNRKVLFYIYRFEMTYYTCGGSQCQLIVDTRGNSASRARVDENVPTVLNNLEKLIHTK